MLFPTTLEAIIALSSELEEHLQFQIERHEQRLAEIAFGVRIFERDGPDGELIDITPNEEARCRNIIVACRGVLDSTEVARDFRRLRRH
ncbi:hypothetical protein [Neorhizobium vignae]|uniref:hypothetical protein n=1 Tax=Neorhizobium vignae TaxID=690585 RepID=UPI00056170A3|nr:hypothetical protein [Neorhizobium vignae]